MTTKKKLWIGVVVGLVLVLGVLAGTKAAQIGSMIEAGKSFSPPPESVASAKAEPVEWEATTGTVGTLVAVQSVTLGAELPGTVREIGFESGAAVKRGQVLVRLDTSAEEAQLAAAQADAALAKLNLERAQTLRAAGTNAPAELDAAEARAKAAAAAVKNLEATIAKKVIRAPFDGRISIRQVELGQVVAPGTPIASLHSVSPIHAEFSLPQQALAEVQVGQRARVRTDAFPGATWDGKVTTINPEVDVATRTVRVRATVDNAGGKLRPGMFANVDVLSAQKEKALVIPATAVLFAPYGDSVFVIEKKQQDGKEVEVVQQKFVRLGERRGDFVAVTSGLEPGETVVSAGAFKLRNGMAVAVNDSRAPKPELAPKPTDD
jgi:membrane fusion protein (multidrug efflux system)